jgi:hypothetical protein
MKDEGWQTATRSTYDRSEVTHGEGRSESAIELVQTSRHRAGCLRRAIVCEGDAGAGRSDPRLARRRCIARRDPPLVPDTEAGPHQGRPCVRGGVGP